MRDDRETRGGETRDRRAMRDDPGVGDDLIVGEPGALLVIVSGPSGVGKDTVITELALVPTDPPRSFVITCTTRPRREYEVDGVHYHFLDQEAFERRRVPLAAFATERGEDLARIVALLTRSDSIREVIAFPKSGGGYDPLTGAPAPITRGQRKEAGIDAAPPAPKEPTAVAKPGVAPSPPSS